MFWDLRQSKGTWGGSKILGWSDRTGRNGLKLHQGLDWKKRGKNITERVVKHWNRLPIGAVEHSEKLWISLGTRFCGDSAGFCWIQWLWSSSPGFWDYPVLTFAGWAALAWVFPKDLHQFPIPSPLLEFLICATPSPNIPSRGMQPRENLCCSHGIYLFSLLSFIIPVKRLSWILQENIHK